MKTISYGNALQIRSRKLDYLQLQWLEKTTGVSAANWDLYVIKELIDNALDADEAAGFDPVEIEVNIRYARDKERDLFSLEIDVANQAVFPLKQVNKVFDLGYYASSKSGLNVPTRGKQGNALKTIAGIPYALRHFHYGDYEVARRPIIIEVGEQGFMIAYRINDETEEISLQISEVKAAVARDKYNWIRVGIDRFVQSSPRQIEELLEIGRSMALFNPHVYFKWVVNIGGKVESWIFQGRKEWLGKFSGMAPISWYDVGQFRSLIASQVREKPDVSVQTLVASFPGFTGLPIRRVCRAVPAVMAREVLDSRQLVQLLYDEMIAAEATLRRRTTVTDLGGIGATSIAQNVKEFFGAPQQTSYQQVRTQDPLRPSCPFVLEVFGARFEKGLKRTIWTGINNTFNYDDPFSRTTLLPPTAALGAEVRGLREFVETFGVSGTTPFVIAIHLISPNIRYQDFSKTFIDGAPFREKLELTLSEVLEELTQGKEEAERKHAIIARANIKQLIPQAVGYLSPHSQGYFSIEQLVLTIQQLYDSGFGAGQHKPTIVETREAIEEYDRENPNALTKLIRRREVQIYLPGDNEPVRVAATSVTKSALAGACVNKVLVFSNRGMCDVFVANDLLRRFDIALIEVDGASHAFFDVVRSVAGWGVPLLLAHDATISGCAWKNSLQEFLRYRKINLDVYDLGLTPAQGRELKLSSEPTALSDHDRQKRNPALSEWEQHFLFDEGSTYSLLALSSHLLKDWFQGGLTRLGIREKLEPPNEIARTAAQKIFRMTIERWVLEKLGAELGIDAVFDSVVNSVLGRSKAVELSRQIHFASDEEKTYSWYELLEGRVSVETLKQIRKNEQELRNLIRRKAGITG
jgi:hypothetical protein